MDPVFEPGRLHRADLLELGAVSLQGLLAPLGFGKARFSNSGPGRTRPVILVHGFQSSRAGLWPMVSVLRLVGFDRVFNFGYRQSLGLEATAGLLAEKIKGFHRACGGRQTVDIVAHCTGGLLARLAAQERDCASLIDRLVTLATPHYGTLSPFWRVTPLAEDLQPHSPFLQVLKRGEAKASGLRYSSLWSERDLLILPQENARFLGGESQPVSEAGHSGLLLHRPSLKWLIALLAEGQSLPRGRRKQALQLLNSLKNRTFSEKLGRD